MTSRSPRGAAHPGNGVIAPFHGERPRNRGVKDTHRPPFSAPSSRRRPSETAIRTASPALTLKSSRPGTTNRSRLRDGVGRYESDRRGPGQGGRARLAQCEPSATQSASPRAVRARRDIIRLSSIRASPPGAMRAQVTSPKRLPRGRGGLAGGGTGWAKESAIQDMAGRPRGWRHRVCRPKRLPRGWGTCRRTARSARPRASGPPGTIVPVIVNDCVDVGPPRATRDGRRTHMGSRGR